MADVEILPNDMTRVEVNGTSIQVSHSILQHVTNERFGK